MIEPDFINFPKSRMPITIFPAVFGSKFRFRSKEDMRRLLNMWHLPEKVYLDDYNLCYLLNALINYIKVSFHIGTCSILEF